MDPVHSFTLHIHPFAMVVCFQIKYGGLDDDDETSPLPRTRGRKINYQEVAGSESEEVC